MKNTTKFLTLVLLASTLFTACDKGNSDPKNHLKIGDKEYKLSSGILENYGTDSVYYDGYNADLILFSDSISYELVEKEGESYRDMIGNGHGIWFSMFSTEADVLDKAKYTFSTTEPCGIGTFDDGACVINYDSEEEESGFESDIVSGTVDVSVSGSTYRITIDCTNEKGEKVTGFYKGTLTYYDESESEKSASLKSAKQNKFLK
ncbi:MAG: hypothetical protein ACK5M7_04830 [Draconibacterium sp.]